MDVEEEDEEELQGLEWEAEKAYIVATSPRSLACGSPSRDDKPEDDFSWEEQSSATINKATVPRIVVSSDAEPSPSLEDGEKVAKSSENLKNVLTEKAPLPFILEDDNEASVETANNGEYQPVRGATNGATSNMITNGDTNDASERTKTQPKNITGSSTSSPSSSSTHSVTNSNASLPLPPSPDILVIYGPSGIGLSTLVKKLVYHSPQKFSLVISHTSRSPRPNEMYARDYYFVSREDFLHKVRKGKFMEYVQISRSGSTSYSAQVLSPRKSYSAFPPTSVVKAGPDDGDLYGTTWESFREAQYSGKASVIFNVSTKGAEQLKENGVKGHYLRMSPVGLPIEGETFVPDHVIRFSNMEEGFGLLENHTLQLTEGDRAPKIPSQLEKAMEDWERVPSIQLVKDEREGRTERLTHKQISFSELLTHFQSSDLSEQLSQIKPESSSKSKLSKVFGPPKLTKQLHEERNLIFAMALCKFDDHNTFHTRALSTVYQRLSGSTAPCPRFGSHWEDVGFQGSDPTDDFRGVGMLGLFQLLWFLDSQRLSSIALDIFRYSKLTPTPLPFCVVSLNITCICLQALREGCLSKECNRSGEVVHVCNNFFASIFVSFYHSWRRHKKGVMELGNVLQNVGNFAKRNAKFMMRELEVYIVNQRKGKAASQLVSPEMLTESSIAFSPLENTVSV